MVLWVVGSFAGGHNGMNLAMLGWMLVITGSVWGVVRLADRFKFWK